VRVAWIVLLLGCEAPHISVAAAPDSATDSSVDAPKTCKEILGPDSKVCTGPDEDDDCIRDACDDCPNVPQEVPVVRAPGQAAVGKSCMMFAPFDTVTRRLFFDPFTDVAAWTEITPPLGPDEALHIVDGAAQFGFAGDRVAWVDATNTAADVIATTVFEAAGRMGVVLRYSPVERTGYTCTVIGALLEIATIQCTSGDFGDCRFKLMTTPGGVTLSKSVPTWERRMLLRAAIIATPTGAKLACQAFPAPKTVDDIKATLRNVDEVDKWTLTADLVNPAASGAVGMFSRGGQARISSFDVLSSP
jgi:hypothetical protein